MDDQKELLASILRTVSINNRSMLEDQKKGYKEIKRPDFLWHFLLQSFSTMGRSSGWNGLIGNKENYNKVKYDHLNSLSEIDREALVKLVCREAKVRMPNQKAKYILKCFIQIKNMGGPEAAKEKLFSLKGRNQKISFLRQFYGIGPKYSRNIMMDVYHEDFRDSIAIDARIKAISKLLDLNFRKYEEEENFYLEVGKKANLNGWEVDRLLYNHRTTVEEMIKNNV